MTPVTRKDSIERLGLSTRTYNCLRRAGIHTVEQLLDFPPEQYRSVRNLGAKSIAELEAVTASLYSGGELFLTELAPQDVPKVQLSNASALSVQPPSPLPGISIQWMNLSVRAINCLTSAGILTADGLTGMTESDLLQIPHMGVKTAKEILARVDELRQRQAARAAAQIPPEVREAQEARNDAINEQLESLAAFTGAPRSDLARQLYACQDQDFTAEPLALLYRQDAVRRLVRRALLILVEDRPLSTRELLAQMPAGTTEEELDGFLAELEERGAVLRRKNGVRRRYPTAMEFAQSRSTERNRDMLLSRLRGETLEEIGQRYGITRERVRQLTQKELTGHPRLFEDRYQDLFNRYEFSLETFQLAFNEPPETYYYLEILRPRKEPRRPLKEILADASIPTFYRGRAQRVVYRDYVRADGVRVEKSSAALAEHTVRTRCRELTSMSEFMARYQDFLNSLGLGGDPELAIEQRTYENKLSGCNYVLWNQWRSFRYYPIAEREYGPLLEGLNLEQYENLELSTLKLFRDHRDLMEEYDIRDEYELHNLLRKICPPDSGVRFPRMPTIWIGQPNRDEQVWELLLQTAPILNTDFAERYEALYGVKSATVLADYLSSISLYLHNNIYRVDLPSLPEVHRLRLEQRLTGDFYTLPEIRHIYQREFPGSAELSYINAFSLRTLGFRVYTDYVVRDTYTKAVDYFRHILTSGGVMDMREESRRYSGIVTYSNELMDLKNQRQIVEFSPLQYIHISRLEEAGVTREDLDSYCAAVDRFVEPGSYFTVASLAQDGFAHPLEDAGFEPWFYASLLAVDAGRFSYRRTGGTRLFRRSQEPFRVSDFLTWLVEEAGRMDVYDLQQLLAKRYGIVLPEEKIKDMIRSTELYYDPIMDAVYRNYDTYFEEV